jgi:hypothetical protein
MIKENNIIANLFIFSISFASNKTIQKNITARQSEK